LNILQEVNNLFKTKLFPSQTITDNTATSKRAIAKAAKKEFNSNFDVVCSTGDFSYLANTRIYCEHKASG
jgi:hypothetical protein